jgi:hypothetical protein
MAPLDANLGLSVRGFGQASGGRTRCSFFLSLCWSCSGCCRAARCARIRRRGIRFCRLGIAHRGTIEGEAIVDGVGEGRLADDFVPCLDRELAGDQLRAGAGAVLDERHEVAPLIRRQPIRSPAIEDQQVSRCAQEIRWSIGAGDHTPGMVRLRCHGGTKVSHVSPLLRCASAFRRIAAAWPMILWIGTRRIGDASW